MEKLKIIGRGSRLSLLQLEKVKQRIEERIPGMQVELITRSSRGDELVDIPLQTMEGSDFFTREIFHALETGEAAIAVHSLKDMSSEHFFGKHHFAVTHRDDTRDIVLFNENILEKIREGKEIVIGTCSPRRELMATSFLQKALPQFSNLFKVVTKDIRGNVDTRLRKLDEGEYDGIILATAGLNRLLESPDDASLISSLLKNKKQMLLPLIECVPAPCQGAIVAEASPYNQRALEVLEIINDPSLLLACTREKKLAINYGAGCLQRFGVTTIAVGGHDQLFAAGIDQHGNAFENWTGLPVSISDSSTYFNTADHMGSFFEYEFSERSTSINEKIVFVANHKSVHSAELINRLKEKQVWAAGSKSWYELAKKGIWVKGCADGFGLEFLENAWSMPLLRIPKENVCILTHMGATEGWIKKGWKATSSYSLVGKRKESLSRQLQQADNVFWTSYAQYELYEDLLKHGVQHACPSGETAAKLTAKGLQPVVFPNIKAFQQWRKINTGLPSVA